MKNYQDYLKAIGIMVIPIVINVFAESVDGFLIEIWSLLTLIGIFSIFPLFYNYIAYRFYKKKKTSYHLLALAGFLINILQWCMCYDNLSDLVMLFEPLMIMLISVYIAIFILLSIKIWRENKKELSDN